MRIPAATGALLIAISTGFGCSHAGGTLPVDAPKLLPYQAPDIDEITGIDSDEEAAPTPAPAAKPASGSTAGSAQNPHK